jgi:DNA topoisomerase-1
LGKDSVPHIFTTKLPEKVINNLQEFSENSESALFNGVRSSHVSEFLDEVMTGLSAKVFRTLYSSDAVKKKLEKTPVEVEDPEYVKKYVAKMANLEAAKVCNHKRTIPKRWKASLQKKRERVKVLKERAKKAQNKIKNKAKEQDKLYRMRLRKQEEKLKTAEEKLEKLKQQLEERKKQGKSVKAMTKRFKSKRRVIVRTKQRIKDFRAKHKERIKKRKLKLEKRKQRDRVALEKMKLKMKLQEETRDYNLSTSLKSYIDPRIYYEWGKKVEYDWKKYYQKVLHKKFSWVETQEVKTENS